MTPARPVRMTEEPLPRPTESIIAVLVVVVAMVLAIAFVVLR